MNRLRPPRDGTIEPNASRSPNGPEPVLPETVLMPSPVAAEPSTGRAAKPGKDRTDPALAKPLTPRVLLGELWHAFFRTGVTGLATQFAYSLFFATFPLLVLVMSLAALVERLFDVQVANTLRDIIDRSAPI